MNKNSVITVAGYGPGKKIERAFFFNLTDSIIYPFSLAPVAVDGDGNILALHEAMTQERLLAIFPPLPPPDELLAAVPGFVPQTITINNIAYSKLGVLVRVVKELKFPDGSVRAVLRGIKRIVAENFTEAESGAPVAEFSTFPSVPGENDDEENRARAKSLVSTFLEFSTLTPGMPDEVGVAINNAPNATRLADLIAETLNFSMAEKYLLLALPTLRERLELLAVLINREIEVMREGIKIQSKVHEAMSASQREFFLREQLRTIKEELGEETRNPDLVELSERLAKTDLPDDVLEVVSKELARLDLIPQAAPEYHISYTYISWLLDVPWRVFTEDHLDAADAARILDEDHYGLEDVKKRILEFIAVLELRSRQLAEQAPDSENPSENLNKLVRAPILCLIGPPGVGKTSLGQSIAKAMNRNFIRVSLGGVRDEAEIRGHRRTYVGAMPGRIIQNLKRAGSNNPVFMLDEVDKLAHDFRGDPASALLEVLDPEQNFSFNDNYLELGFDLSKIFFIATANVEEQIPGPLRDRMEIIRLSGYTALEKKEIARRYLVPRQLKACGLDAKCVKFNAAALTEIIEGYTLEAGVRNLEREIGRVCRRLTQKIVAGELAENEKISVNPALIHELLGARKILPPKSEERVPGFATGMAWTGAGGVTLPVEAIAIPGGKGGLKLTGNIGKVMDESAQTAFSLVRSIAHKYRVEPDYFNTRDFHIHVPDGATPKDGPSAGITLTLALISLIKNQPLRSHLAMTGEITLTGRVTAVGGIREKVVAALRAGMKHIIMPLENQRDYDELPDEVRSKMEFHFVERYDEAEKIAFATGGKK